MTDRYESPLSGRYASAEMNAIFSDDFKFSTWRKLWTALAEAERELGLDISEQQIEELRSNINNINYDVANAKEKELRHDVMAHIHAYGEQCPTARGIIHLGATSCFVGDNAEIIRMKSALRLIKRQIVTAIRAASEFASRYKAIPCLAYTHFQPAQPTTVGKRATLWIWDLIMDLERLDFVLEHLMLLGCKGTTGTGASFLSLFNGDGDKVLELERHIASKMGFTACYPVSGQTYSRKIDYQVLSVLSDIAQSAAKFSNDIRLLSHLNAVDEPFAVSQVGSSAMAYKRNPMRSERIASLSRFIIVTAQNAALTASAQWLERTLDDSANKRLTTSESFLATDAVLALYTNVISGLTVFPNVLAKQLSTELPFLITENILMYCVKKGGDRQALHEAIRRHSVAAAKKIKEVGAENDLLERIINDPIFCLSGAELDNIVSEGNLTGLSEVQVDVFLRDWVDPILAQNKEIQTFDANVKI